jgi:hypothetical protein
MSIWEACENVEQGKHGNSVLLMHFFDTGGHSLSC